MCSRFFTATPGQDSSRLRPTSGVLSVVFCGLNFRVVEVGTALDGEQNLGNMK